VGVSEVYKDYGRGNIRLSRCHKCNKLADKYVEFEMVIIFLDLVLLTPQVYRHILFNRMSYYDKGIDVTCMKIALAYLLSEVYMKHMMGVKGGWQSLFQPQNVETYFTALLFSTLELCIFLTAIILAVSVIYGRRYAIIKYNYLVMALIISTFSKPLQLFLVVWDCQPIFTTIVDIFIFASNVVATKVFLDCSIKHALAIITFGFGVKCLFQLLCGNAPPILLLH